MIRWLIQSVVDHPALSAGRPPTGLLTAAELCQYHAYLSPRRRRDWLLGRWTAKRLVQQYSVAIDGFSPALDSFTVEQEPDGAPYISSHNPALRTVCQEGRIPLALSISHSHGYAFCALCANHAGSARLGVDIEVVEPRGESFAKEFFTPGEQTSLNAAPPTLTDLLATATWSAKEAVCKATHLGLRIDPRSVHCLPRPIYPLAWTPLRVHIPNFAQSRELGPLSAWWRVLKNPLLPHSPFVLTIAAYRASL